MNEVLKEKEREICRDRDREREKLIFCAGLPDWVV